MGRDADPNIKIALLENILDYFLINGIQNLSLRPLATALNTNARMLIYHFGSKENLIIEALELAQHKQLEALSSSPAPQENPEDELLYLWSWFSSDSFLPFAKLLLEIETQGINGNDYYRSFSAGIFEGWHLFIQSRFEQCNPTTAYLIVNTISGLLLNKLITQKHELVDASFQALVDLLIATKQV